MPVRVDQKGISVLQVGVTTNHVIDWGPLMRRCILAIVALSFPVVAALSFSGSAAAATSVSCTGWKGHLNTTSGDGKDHLTGCGDTKNTGGKGSFGTVQDGTTFTITWNGTGTTVVGSVTYAGVSSPTCPAGDTEDSVSGDITGGTGAAAKSIKTGWTLKADYCYNSTSRKISIAPGSTWEMGAGL